VEVYVETPYPAQEFGKPSGHLWRERLANASRFWEPRRIIYNLVLATVVLVWIFATWPHFRSTIILSSLLPLAILATLANVCYSAAYAVDIPLQRSLLATIWSKQRWVLWLVGTLFAVVLTNYWIVDEIYPYVR
jgi:hypothetical protein